MKMNRRSLMKSAFAVPVVSSMGATYPAIAGTPRIKFHRIPGEGVYTKEFIDWATAEFPMHAGHTWVREAMVSLTQTWYCRDCQGSVLVRGFAQMAKSDAKLPEPPAMEQWPHVTPVEGFAEALGGKVQEAAKDDCFVDFDQLRLKSTGQHFVSLSKQVTLPDPYRSQQPSRIDVQDFAAMLQLLQQHPSRPWGDLMTVLMAPCTMRLASVRGVYDRAVINVYIASHCTREVLNGIVGFDAFVREGELGDVWPWKWGLHMFLKSTDQPAEESADYIRINGKVIRVA